MRIGTILEGEVVLVKMVSHPSGSWAKLCHKYRHTAQVSAILRPAFAELSTPYSHHLLIFSLSRFQAFFRPVPSDALFPAERRNANNTQRSAESYFLLASIIRAVKRAILKTVSDPGTPCALWSEMPTFSIM